MNRIVLSFRFLQKFILLFLGLNLLSTSLDLIVNFVVVTWCFSVHFLNDFSITFFVAQIFSQFVVVSNDWLEFFVLAISVDGVLGTTLFGKFMFEIFFDFQLLKGFGLEFAKFILTLYALKCVIIKSVTRIMKRVR